MPAKTNLPCSALNFVSSFVISTTLSSPFTSDLLSSSSFTSLIAPASSRFFAVSKSRFENIAGYIFCSSSNFNCLSLRVFVSSFMVVISRVIFSLSLSACSSASAIASLKFLRPASAAVVLSLSKTNAAPRPTTAVARSTYGFTIIAAFNAFCATVTALSILIFATYVPFMNISAVVADITAALYAPYVTASVPRTFPTVS